MAEIKVKSEITGTVWQVKASPGDKVEAGDTLVVIESMKMELSITAPHAGTVTGLALAPGDRVALRQPLLAVVASGDEGEGEA